MPFYAPPPTPASFQQILDSFVQRHDLPFGDVLTQAQIEQIAAEEQVAFGAGTDDIWSVPLTLWAFLTQVIADQKSCVAAVARVIVLLTTLGRQACHAGSGAYCKARAKLPERFLRRLAGTVGEQLAAHLPDAWRWHGHRVELVDGSTLSMPDTEANQAVYPQSRRRPPAWVSPCCAGWRGSTGRPVPPSIRRSLPTAASRPVRRRCSARCWTR